MHTDQERNGALSAWSKRGVSLRRLRVKACRCRRSVDVIPHLHVVFSRWERPVARQSFDGGLHASADVGR